MELWLMLSDFQKRVNNLPESFDLLNIATQFQQVFETDFYALIGSVRVNELTAWLEDNQPEVSANDLKQKALFDLSVPYLVYSIWAGYITESEVQATDSGLVKKEADHSQFLDKDEKAYLSRKYRDLAAVWRNRIVEFVLTTNACYMPGKGYSTRIGKAAPPNKSRF